MLINYLDPETLLHLKESFPKCMPEYPHIEKLPGLIFAYKTKEVLTKNREYPSGLSYFRNPPAIPQFQYHGVFILSIENHHPYSFETNGTEDVYYQYNQTHQTRHREPFSFPFVKPGDVFLSLQTWVSEASSLADSIDPTTLSIPTTAFITDTYRLKYYYIQTRRDFNDVKENYVNLEKRGDAMGARYHLWNDIANGFINWTYPFDTTILYDTMNEIEGTDDKAVALSRGVYATHEVREFCEMLGVSTGDTVEEMGNSLFALVGFTVSFSDL